LGGLARQFHCLVQINDTATFLCGGQNTSSTGVLFSDAYVYSWTASTWTKVASMPSADYQMACTLLTDGNGMPTGVLTAGEEIHSI
jgi:hypothetical protein